MLAIGSQKRTDSFHPHWMDPCSPHAHRLSGLWRKLPVQLQHPAAAGVSVGQCCFDGNGKEEEVVKFLQPVCPLWNTKPLGYVESV